MNECEFENPNQRLLDIVEYLPDATFIIDTNHKVLIWNKAMEIMTGIKKKDIIGKGNKEYSQAFFNKQRPLLADLVIEGGKNISKYYKVYRKEKDSYYIESFVPKLHKGKGAYNWAKASILYDSNKKIIGVIETIRDITDKIIVEENLKISEKKYRELAESLPQTVYETDLNGKITFINSIVLDQFGYTKEEVLNRMLIFDILDPKEKNRAKKLFTDRIKGKKPTYTIFNSFKKDGTRLPIIVYSSIIHDKNDKAIGFRGVVIDVTQQQLYAEKLKASEEKYQSLFELSPDAIGVVTDKKFVFANKKMLELLRAKSFDEIKNKDISTFIDKASKDYFLRKIDEIYKTGQNMPLVEERLITLDKQTIDVEVTASRLKGIDDDSIQIIYRDISQSKKLEEGLQKLYLESSLERQKIEVVMDSMGDAVVALDKQKRIIFANPSASQLIGETKMKMAGKLYNEVFKFVFEKNTEKEMTFIDEVYATGKIIEIEDQAVLINKNNIAIPVADSAAPIKDHSGNVVGCVIIFRDVTKERQINKVKSEFVSVASHQLRTPLSAIKWFLELMGSDTSGQLSEDQKNYLNQMTFSTNRMIKLINELLNVSRIETGNIQIRQKSLNLNNFIKNISREIMPKISEKKQHLILKTDKHLTVHSDEVLLRQVIENLITNANRYSPIGGRIVIKTYKKENWATFEIKDNGYGIPENQKERMFTKFFRADNIITKQTDGTGLGLFVAKSAIETLGGKIWFESKENIGSIFYFNLPLNKQLSKR